MEEHMSSLIEGVLLMTRFLRYTQRNARPWVSQPTAIEQSYPNHVGGESRTGTE